MLFTLGAPNGSAAVPCSADGVPLKGWGGSGAPPWLSALSVHTAATPWGPWTSRVLLTGALNANPTAWVDPETGAMTLLYGRS